MILISGKLPTDKRCPSDFRHINTRVTKTNLAFPLVRDICAMLASSKCEVLLVSNLKDGFHRLRLTEESKKCFWILTLFSCASCTKECQWI